MPNISEFEAGNLALRPTETGVEARAGTARRIGAFSNQMASAEDTLARETSRLASETSKLGGETSALGSEKGAMMADTGRRIGSSISEAGDAAVKYLDAKQVSQGSAAYTSLMLQKTQQWNDTIKNADPNDPTVAAKFMASSEADLQKFKENGFYTENGQKWAEAHVDALRQHLAEKTQADMATMAGHAAVVNQQQTINALSANVHSDPTSLDFSLAALKSTTEGLIAHSPNLTGTQASAARSEILQKGAEAIVKSAAIGYIEKTSRMPEWATDPKYAPYINGAELKMFEKAAQQQAKVDLLQQKQMETFQRQKDERAAEDAANKAVTKNVAIDPQTNRPIIAPQYFKDALDIAKMPNAPVGLARTLLDWGEHQQNVKATVVDDPAVRQSLTDRLFDPTNPTTRQDLMKAQIAGKLSDHSFSAMERLVTDLEQTPLKGEIWKATTTAVKAQLISSVLPEGKDKIGTANYASFMQDFLPKYIAKSRAGTLPDNALNTNDPNSMISQSLKPYKVSMQDRLRIGSDAGAAAKPPDANQPIPKSLMGVASLTYSKSRNLYRDDTTGKLYKPDGTPNE